MKLGTEKHEIIYFGNKGRHYDLKESEKCLQVLRRRRTVELSSLFAAEPMAVLANFRKHCKGIDFYIYINHP